MLIFFVVSLLSLIGILSYCLYSLIVTYQMLERTINNNKIDEEVMDHYVNILRKEGLL